MEEGVNDMSIITEIDFELSLVEAHIRKYHVGYYPLFYFTKHYFIKVKEVFPLCLNNFYEIEEESVKVKDLVQIGKRTIELSKQDRLNLSWYLLQRIPIKSVTEEKLADYMCINRDGNLVQAAAYRMVLERTSRELNLSRVYNTSCIKACCAYRDISLGKRTLNEVAALLGCSKYHLIDYILNPFPRTYDSEIVKSIAGIEKTEQTNIKFL